jgi:hypothetical protein
LNTNKEHRFLEFALAFIVLSFAFLAGIDFWLSAGIALFVYFSYRFFNNLGNRIDIRDMIIFFPIVQWIIGPILSYRFLTDDVSYYMVIPEDDYMSFAVPGVLLFAVGLYLPFFKTTFEGKRVLSGIETVINRFPNLDILFIVVGLLLSIIEPFLPIQLRFFVFLAGNLQFIGLFFLMLNKKRKRRNLLFYSFLALSFLLSVAQGMFHVIILWYSFLFFIVSFIKNFKPFKKVLIILLFLFAVVIIQTVKYEFREIVWYGKKTDNSSPTSVFFNLVSKNIENKELLASESNINNLITRINQGWIIARIMDYTPRYEPFAKGETIWNALQSSFVPRFLSSEKSGSGGKEYYPRFTGLELGEGTSMDLSILGEAYANFGRRGIYFMLIYGLFLSLTYSGIIHLFKKRPTLLFFIPLIYLQVVKAESDFLTALNHFVKASIFVVILYWGLLKFLKIKL